MIPSSSLGTRNDLPLIKHRKLNFNSEKSKKITISTQESLPIAIRPRDVFFQGKSNTLKGREIKVAVNPIFTEFPSRNKSITKLESMASSSTEESYFVEMSELDKQILEERFQKLEEEELDFDFSSTEEEN